MEIPGTLREIARRISAQGGRAMVGGGALRDHFMGETDPKDFDVEVHGLELASLQALLAEFGEVKAVGSAFGVLKLRVGEEDFDFSLPRRESKTGAGHKGFLVELAPSISVEEACSRRDFTMNSALLDLETGNVHDPFGAEEDIARSVLRHTSEKFIDDPLRPLRGFQFAARFGFVLDSETADLCRGMSSEFPTLPVERVWGEWEKWATKGRYPGMGLRALADMGWLPLFPELQALGGLKQNPKFHPEGDVWEHTLLTCHEAQRIAERENLGDRDRMVLLFAALCHDLGKASTTAQEEGKITSKGHSHAGEEPTRSFLGSIGAPVWLIDAVIPLVVEHMAHVGVIFSKSLVRRLAVRLEPTTIPALVRVIEADRGGRHPLPGGNPCPELLALAKELDLEAGKPKPILLGRHLVEAGLQPGPLFGKILAQGFEAQLRGEISSEQTARAWLFGHIT